MFVRTNPWLQMSVDGVARGHDSFRRSRMSLPIPVTVPRKDGDLHRMEATVTRFIGCRPTLRCKHHAFDDRQLRQLHLQPRAVFAGVGRGGEGGAQRRADGRRDRTARAGADRGFARPVHAERGRRVDRGDRTPRRRVPILGVCLGHQSIGQAYGGDVVRAGRIMHGKTSRIRHEGKGVFAGLPDGYEATRYHSLVVDKRTLPDCLSKSPHGPSTKTARSRRSWACATASIRCRACSSTPSRS